MYKVQYCGCKSVRYRTKLRQCKVGLSGIDIGDFLAKLIMTLKSDYATLFTLATLGKEHQLKGERLTTFELLVITSLIQLLLILETLFTFLKNTIP